MKSINNIIICCILLLLSGVMEVWAAHGRIEISQAMVPCTITNSGSYVLTEDLVNTNNAVAVIRIEAPYVTVDLAGHIVVQEASLHAIWGLADCITVMNGSVRCPSTSASYGVYLNGNYQRVENLRIRQARESGILTGKGSIVRNCVISESDVSTLGYGFKIGHGSMLLDSRVSEFRGGGSSYSFSGIEAGWGCLVANCQVISNSCASTMVGIDGNVGTLVLGCQVAGNQGNPVTGIDLASGSIVADTVVCNNTTGGGGVSGNGISAGKAALITESTIKDQGTGVEAELACLINNCVIAQCKTRGALLDDSALILNSTFHEAMLEIGDHGMVAESSFWSNDHSLDLMHIGSACYILENNLWGFLDGIQINGNNSRIDRNSISAGSEINAIGSSNLIVRTRSDFFQVNGAGDNFVGETVTGAPLMSTPRPWGNTQ